MVPAAYEPRGLAFQKPREGSPHSNTCSPLPIALCSSAAVCLEGAGHVCEVGVLQGVLAGDAAARVDRKQLLQGRGNGGELEKDSTRRVQ